MRSGLKFRYTVSTIAFINWMLPPDIVFRNYEQSSPTRLCSEQGFHSVFFEHAPCWVLDVCGRSRIFSDMMGSFGFEASFYGGFLYRLAFHIDDYFFYVA